MNSVLPPTVLNPESYPEIERFLVEQDRDNSGDLLKPGGYAVRSQHISNLYGRKDLSLTGQLGQAILHPEALHGAGTPAPDSFIFTANSAIPLADAIRGYYDAAGLPTPPIASVAANRDNSSAFYHHDPDAIFTSEALINQLHSDLPPETKHVCIVDEFTFTGSTAHYAGYMALQAGIPYVTTFIGNWYEHAHRDDILIEEITSVHADFMYAAGAKMYNSLEIRSEETV